MDEKHLSFAQVTDIYGFRVIVPTVTDCYTAMGLLHQLYKPVPGKFKDHIAIPKINGYQSLHTTLVGPSGVNVEFQLRTEAMHLVAESGVAAHWLYKASTPQEESTERLGTKWLQSLLDIQNETRDAAEFWDHVKIDLFPDAVYVFTPKSQILALPRGATVVDFAYAIHSDVGDHTVAARINGAQVPLRTELKNGDVVEVVTAPGVHAQPGLAGLRAHRPGPLQDPAPPQDPGAGGVAAAGREAAGAGAARRGHGEAAAGRRRLPPLWEKLLRFTGNRSRAELLTDLGLGKRIAGIVAKRLMPLLGEMGEKPDALLLSRERFTAHENVSQGGPDAGRQRERLGAVRQLLPAGAGRRHPRLPGARRRPGGAHRRLHGRQAPAAQGCRALHRRGMGRRAGARLRDRRAGDRRQRQGRAGRVAAALANAEADITHVDMDDERAQDATDLRFVVSVRDRAHLGSVLRNLKRTPSVMNAVRIRPGGGGFAAHRSLRLPPGEPSLSAAPDTSPSGSRPPSRPPASPASRRRPRAPSAGRARSARSS